MTSQWRWGDKKREKQKKRNGKLFGERKESSLRDFNNKYRKILIRRKLPPKDVYLCIPHRSGRYSDIQMLCLHRQHIAHPLWFSLLMLPVGPSWLWESPLPQSLPDRESQQAFAWVHIFQESTTLQAAGDRNPHWNNRKKRKSVVELGETERCCIVSMVPLLDSVPEDLPLVLLVHLKKSDNKTGIDIIIL